MYQDIIDRLISSKVLTKFSKIKACSLEKLEEYPNLKTELINATSFLDYANPSLLTRLKAIQDNVIEVPLCLTCNAPIAKVTREYRFKKFCNRTCKAKNAEQLEKIVNTCLERYGVKNPYQRQHNRDKAQASYEERFEGGHPLKDPKVQAKRISTVIRRYGVDNIMKDVGIFSRSRRYNNKSLTLPSGQVRLYQGFEDVAILHLLQTYSEDEIISERTHLPVIIYDATRRYFPDIYIPKDNLIIEVKSTWTYRQHFERNQLKKKAAEQAGYSFQFWICSNSSLTEII